MFAAATVGLSAGGHVLAGGAPPGIPLLGLLFALVAVVFSVVARREQSLPRLLVGVGAAQAVLHQLLSMGGHHHATSGAGDTSSAVTMLAGHAVAGALLAVWLRQGEAAIWRFTRRVVRTLTPTHPSPALAARPRPLNGDHRAQVLPHGLLPSTGDPRRGPPLPA